MSKLIFNYIIFPGFLFTAVAGMLASWIDRKVTARVQWRVGPPLLQPLYDIIKLSGKEIIVPSEGNCFVFLVAPLVGFASIILVSTMLWLGILEKSGFSGDFIVVFYLLTMPSIMLMLGAFASANPLASLGASREMKLVMGYELPFVLAAIVPVIKSGGHITLSGIISAQSGHVFLASCSGFVAFIVSMLCMQAKLGLVPFDAPEAETEIMGGVVIEYSGIPLGIFKLTKWMMMVTLPVFLIVLFWGGMGSFWEILKYVVLLVVIVLLRNTNPRVRVDQALRFFWGPMTALSLIAVILALAGK